MIVFITDILIYSSSNEVHKQYIRRALQILWEQLLYDKFSKYEFWTEEIAFLRYIVSRKGVKPDLSKIKAIMEWEAPKSVTEIQSFWDWLDTI